MSRVNSIDGVTLTNANQTGIAWDLHSLNVLKSYKWLQTGGNMGRED